MSKSEKELMTDFEKKEKRRKQLREAQKEFNLLHHRHKKKMQFYAYQDMADFLQLVKEKEGLSNITEVIHLLANEYIKNHNIDSNRLDCL